MELYSDTSPPMDPPHTTNSSLGSYISLHNNIALSPRRVPCHWTYMASPPWKNVHPRVAHHTAGRHRTGRRWPWHRWYKRCCRGGRCGRRRCPRGGRCRQARNRNPVARRRGFRSCPFHLYEGLNFTSLGSSNVSTRHEIILAFLLGELIWKAIASDMNCSLGLILQSHSLFLFFSVKASW